MASRPATGRPSKLTATQQAQVFRWMNGKDPRQYGLDFGLWTRQIAATLIQQKFGVHLGVTAVGRVLARLGLTPQKPLQRAYQRDPQAIERWQRETYPGIAATARRSGADIYFWDESGFRADTVHGKTWAPRGKTPVISRPGQRQSISAASRMNICKGPPLLGAPMRLMSSGLEPSPLRDQIDTSELSGVKVIGRSEGLLISCI